MSHHHLGFKRSDGFQNNAYNNEYRRTAHCNSKLWESKVGENREYCDNAKEERADESYLAEHPLDEIAGGFTGTNTRDTAVILTETVCDLYRIVLHGNLKIGKCNNQQEIKNSLPWTGITEEI